MPHAAKGGSPHRPLHALLGGKKAKWLSKKRNSSNFIKILKWRYHGSKKHSYALLRITSQVIACSKSANAFI
jgi:hypothetical protein